MFAVAKATPAGPFAIPMFTNTRAILVDMPPKIVPPAVAVLTS